MPQLTSVICHAAADPKSAWDKASTIATVGATMAALGVPFLLDWRQRARSRSERSLRRGRIALDVGGLTQEVLQLTDEGRALVEGADPRYMGADDNIRDVAERCSGLRTILDLHGRDDSLLRPVRELAFDAGALAGLVSMALEIAMLGGEVKKVETLGHFNATRARQVRIRNTLKGSDAVRLIFASETPAD